MAGSSDGCFRSSTRASRRTLTAGLFGDGWTGFILGDTTDPLGLAPALGQALSWAGAEPAAPIGPGATAAPAASGAGIDFAGGLPALRKRRGGGLERQLPALVEQEEARRLPLVAELGEALVRFVPHSPTAQILFAEDDPALYAASLLDIARPKATGTLERRLISLRLYARWHAVARPGRRGELLELSLYLYLRALQDEAAPPTRAAAMVEAVRFLLGLAGLSNEIPFFVSKRVEGAALASADRKPVRVQRAPLPHKVVAQLETFVVDDGDVGQRIMAGAFLFLVHARMRWSDLAKVSQEPFLDLDASGIGFVESTAQSQLLKSGRSKKRRGLAVPLVGLAEGVGGRPWASTWLGLRLRAGLDAAVQKTLIPSPISGGWSSTPPSNAEANAWIKAFAAGCGMDDDAVMRIGTHSCKPTTLSWCAKAGVRGELRRLLGGHSKPKERMMLEYSRDALAPALYALMGRLYFDPQWAVRPGRYALGSLRGRSRKSFAPSCSRACGHRGGW